ncbi:MAG: hypothetical protein H0W48_04540 [Methylibium sp.]|nr:hypothetical protein [Methylibium sp.]MBA3623714.1 hypothetical protein [Methylibium sp.]
MTKPLRSHATQSLRTLVLCCLLVALPVYGLAGSIAQWLGVQHSHDHGAVLAHAADPMAGWQDFRRIVAVGDATAHGHDHAALERHHHARGDASVNSLGSDGGDSTPTDGASPVGSAGCMFIPVASSPWYAPTSAAQVWLAFVPPMIASRPPARLDRPPKA